MIQKTPSASTVFPALLYKVAQAQPSAIFWNSAPDGLLLLVVSCRSSRLKGEGLTVS